MRSVIAILLALTLPALAADGVPSFPKATGYAKARSSLIGQGWAPLTVPDAQACNGDPRCKGRPEMEACAGTGMANCLFTWSKGDTVIAVSTVGEGEPQVVGVQCRKGCKR